MKALVAAKGAIPMFGVSRIRFVVLGRLCESSCSSNLTYNLNWRKRLASHLTRCDCCGSEPPRR
ncbi:MAG: hypothetical protein ACOYOU_21070, partial [Kiritimatiellia bacterium]